MAIGRGRRREHLKDTSKGVTTGVAQLPVAHAHIQGNPEGIKWPSVTPGSHVTTVLLLRKKAREKPGMGRTYFRSGPLLDRASSDHVTDVISGQRGHTRPDITQLPDKARDWRHFWSRD